MLISSLSGLLQCTAIVSLATVAVVRQPRRPACYRNGLHPCTGLVHSLSEMTYVPVGATLITPPPPDIHAPAPPTCHATRYPLPATRLAPLPSTDQATCRVQLAGLSRSACVRLSCDIMRIRHVDPKLIRRWCNATLCHTSTI